MLVLQVGQAVVDNLDLFLYYRHPLGKVVMRPDFPGQLFNFGISDRLGDPLVVFVLPCSRKAGHYDTDQRQAAGDQRYDN